MYNKKQRYMVVAAIVAIAACSDSSNPVAVAARPAPPPTVPTSRPPETEERVTVTRTTDFISAPIDGEPMPAPVRRTNTRTFGAVTLTAGHGDESVVNAAAAVRGGGRVTPDNLPIAGLVVPARQTSLRSVVVPWRRSAQLPDDPTVTVESVGSGGAPASTITVSQANGPTLTIRQEWELWQERWNLVRRESRSSDGTFHEVIDVRRTGRTGTALRSPAEWARQLRVGGTRGASLDLYEDDVECGRCGPQLIAANAAFETAIARELLATSICAFPPASGGPVACAIALGAAADAMIAASTATERYELCKATAPPCPPRPKPTGDCLVRSQGNHALTAAFSCSSGGGGGQSDGGGGSTAPLSHLECTYYYEYDIDTGAILYSELLYCRQVSN